MRCIVTGGEARGGGGGVETLFDSCLIRNNYAQYNGGGGDGCVFRNCTLVNNRANHNGAAYCASALENCIVYGNSGMTEEFSGRNLGWGNPLVEAWDFCRVNVCSSNPSFVNAANGDYRLADGSSCIDAGENSYVMGETDLDGNPRISNGRVDLGAYEYYVDPNATQIPVRFVVAYDGGEDIVRTYYEGSRYNSFPNPSRGGYTFVGWFTEMAGGTQILATENVNPSITTLYAHWISYADGQRMALDLGNGAELFDDGNLIWSVDSSTSHQGGSSLKSAAISHSQTTWQSLKVYGSGTMSFWWKVSSESNYDKLRYYVDGIQRGEISGSVDWTRVTFEIEGDGEHIIKWAYTKDGSVNSGSDCGWIDHVEWSGLVSSRFCVTFDMNGGGQSVVRECDNGEKVGVLPPAVRNGYVFAGWFTEQDGGVQVTSEYIVESNVMLYAHWIPEGEVVILSSTVRESDSTVLDVVYRVNSTNTSANVRALVFEDGIESFAKVIRPETFIDGTDANLGYAVPANTNLLLSWKMTSDWDVKLARIKFMILVEENFYPLPLDLVTIPANGSNKAVKFSTNEISVEAFKDALFWLYANKEEGLNLVNGVLSSGGVTIANGTEVIHPEAERYVFKLMGYQLLEGDKLRYVNETARLNLNPQGSKQYVYAQE